MSKAATQALFEALAGSDLAGVRAALQAGAAPNERDSQGSTPLTAAIRAGLPQAVHALLAANAHVDELSFGRTPLSFACSFRFWRKLYRDQVAAHAPVFEEIAKELLEAGASITLNQSEERWLPLSAAMLYGSRGQVELLLAKGAQPKPDVFLEAVQAGDFSIARVLLPILASSVPLGPLLMAATQTGAGHNPEAIQFVKDVIAAGADPNVQDDSGATALHGAVYWDDPDLIEALVAAGASLDIPTTQPWTPEDEPKPKGTTPRGMLDAQLRSAVQDGVDVTQEEHFQRLAAVLGETIEAWSRRVVAPSQNGVAGGWVVAEALVAVDEDEWGDLPFALPPHLELRADGRFTITQGLGLLPTGDTWSGDWKEAKTSKKNSSTVSLQLDGGPTWRAVHSCSTLTLDFKDEEGREVQWNFKRLV